MKTRNGFVSNSSSSSFVVLGIKTDDNCIAERAEELDLYCDWVEGEGYFIIGEKLGDWDAYEGGMNAMNFSDVLAKAQSLTQELTKLNLDEPQPLQLFYGEMMS